VAWNDRELRQGKVAFHDVQIRMADRAATDL